MKIFKRTKQTNFNIKIMTHNNSLHMFFLNVLSLSYECKYVVQVLIFVNVNKNINKEHALAITSCKEKPWFNSINDV